MGWGESARAPPDGSRVHIRYARTSAEMNSTERTPDRMREPAFGERQASDRYWSLVTGVAVSAPAPVAPSVRGEAQPVVKRHANKQ